MKYKSWDIVEESAKLAKEAEECSEAMIKILSEMKRQMEKEKQMNPESDLRVKVGYNEYGVHATHCCEKHGCKYGDENCPVCLGLVKQRNPCEWCMEDGLEWCENYTLDKVPDVPKPAGSLPVTPEPPPKRIIKEDIEGRSFIKGFLIACLIIIILHIGLAYVLL